MMCMSCGRSAEVAGRPSRLLTLATSACAFVRQSWRAYWDWRARRVTVLLLSSLDCRTLRDIGVEAREIESLVDGGGERRRGRDAAWPWRSGGR
jgi:uncharacterized protein YjiS (DUF1127 family)